MNGYKLTIKEQSWRHLTPEQLGTYVRSLGNQSLIFDVEREETPKPAPEVVVKTVEVHHNHYVCPEKGCYYTATSRAGLANHRRTHK